MNPHRRLEVLASRLRRFGQACGENPRISALVGMAHERRCPLHLVGGSVRDILLGHAEPADLDYTLGRDAVAFSQEVAKALGGTWVPLDLDRDMARVVFKRPEGGTEVHDFAAWQASTLEGDLLKRDLTINAMALDPRPWMGMAGVFGTAVGSATGALGDGSEDLAGIVDPAGGQDDLLLGVVRALSAEVLEDDPLRLLRVVRFSATLGFEIEPCTLGWLGPCAPLLGRVADERVRDEFFKILGVPRSGPAVEVLRVSGLLSMVLPELAGGGSEALDCLRRLEDGLAQMRGEGGLVGEHVARMVASGHTAEQVLKLAALLVRSCDASVMEPLARRLRLSRVEETMLERIVRGWRTACTEAASEPVPAHARRRFFAGLKDAGFGAAVLAQVVGPVAEATAATSARIRHSRGLLDWLARSGDEVRVPLLDGREVSALMGVKPGPRLGGLLETLLDAQADGHVRSRDEAVAFLRRGESGTPCEQA